MTGVHNVSFLKPHQGVFSWIHFTWMSSHILLDFHWNRALLDFESNSGSRLTDPLVLSSLLPPEYQVLLLWICLNLNPSHNPICMRHIVYCKHAVVHALPFAYLWCIADPQTVRIQILIHGSKEQNPTTPVAYIQGLEYTGSDCSHGLSNIVEVQISALLVFLLGEQDHKLSISTQPVLLQLIYSHLVVFTTLWIRKSQQTSP